MCYTFYLKMQKNKNKKQSVAFFTTSSGSDPRLMLCSQTALPLLQPSPPTLLAYVTPSFYWDPLTVGGSDCRPVRLSQLHRADRNNLRKHNCRMLQFSFCIALLVKSDFRPRQNIKCVIVT